MRSWTGELAFEDLGAGVWTLRADDGQLLQLAGTIPSELSGRRVRVTGHPVDLHGYGMTAAVGVDVTRVEPLEEG